MIAGPLPLSVSWGDLVDLLAAERGSLAELARCLQDSAPPAASLSDDPLTVERGLRRLRRRGHSSGDKYGRLLLRAFGLPGTMLAWARMLGQYHSRLSDLSVPVRHDQLRLWDRPPISESRAAAWIHLGLASLAHRRRDRQQVVHRMALASRVVARAEPAAALEHRLFEARLASDAAALLDQAASELDAIEDRHDRACYHARIQDQRAYRAARQGAGWREGMCAAQRLYASIPEGGPPFAAFRRAHGLAWCGWRLGEPGALRQAERAVEAAGDGGLLRFRCMALLLLGHVGGEPGAFDRAEAIADGLRDDELIARIARQRRRGGRSGSGE